jgi:hypothetical protein
MLSSRTGTTLAIQRCLLFGLLGYDAVYYLADVSAQPACCLKFYQKILPTTLMTDAPPKRQQKVPISTSTADSSVTVHLEVRSKIL